MGYLLVACFLGSLNKTAAPHVWFFLQRETGVWGQIPARDDAMNNCKSVHFLSPLVWQWGYRCSVSQNVIFAWCLTIAICLAGGKDGSGGFVSCSHRTPTSVCHSVPSVSLHFSRGGTSLSEESQDLSQSPPINHVQIIKWHFSCQVLINAYFQPPQGKDAIPAPVSVEAAELPGSKQGICSPGKVPQALRAVSSWWCSFMPPKEFWLVNAKNKSHNNVFLSMTALSSLSDLCDSSLLL